MKSLFVFVSICVLALTATAAPTDEDIALAKQFYRCAGFYSAHKTMAVDRSDDAALIKKLQSSLTRQLLTADGLSGGSFTEAEIRSFLKGFADDMMKADDNKELEAFLKSTGRSCVTIETDHGERGIEMAIARRKEQEQKR